MAVKPITPKEALKQQQSSIPDSIIEAVNELLVKNARPGDKTITIKQKDIVAKCGIPSSKIFENGWMDIEPIFRKAGWKVSYDKPGYCESYDAYFVFKRGK